MNMSQSGSYPTVHPDSIELLDFRVFRSKIETEDDFLNNPVPVKGYSLEQYAEHGIEKEEEKVGIRIYVAVQGMDEEHNFLGLKGEFGIEYKFWVEGLSDHLDHEGDPPEISGKLVATLAGIAYSTSRGVIYDRVEGSHLQHLILPVVDPKQLLEDQKKEEQ